MVVDGNLTGDSGVSDSAGDWGPVFGWVPSAVGSYVLQASDGSTLSNSVTCTVVAPTPTPTPAPIVISCVPERDVTFDGTKWTSSWPTSYKITGNVNDPGSLIQIKANGTIIHTTTADGNGDFLDPSLNWGSSGFTITHTCHHVPSGEVASFVIFVPSP